jgi:D-glycero-alpha-D-manno-heptose 1-phosphate guanylyltransferase
MEMIDAIILAGGKGTRLREIVNKVPKPMASVNRRPFLDVLLHQLDSFNRIERVVLAVGYKYHMIINRYVSDSRYNFKLVFSVEKALLGTGGAIRKAISLTKSEDILVVNGDSYVEIDFNKFFTNHKSSKALVTLVLKRQEDVRRYGHVEIDEQTRIISFKEKAVHRKPGFVNAGMYLMRRKCIEDVKEGIVTSLEKEILPRLTSSGIHGFITNGKFIDIGIPETYKIVDTYLKGVSR